MRITKLLPAAGRWRLWQPLMGWLLAFVMGYYLSTMQNLRLVDISENAMAEVKKELVNVKDQNTETKQRTYTLLNHPEFPFPEV